MKSSQDPQPLQVWALISRHFSTHIGCSTRPQYPPVFPCVCFHITFVPCLCLHLFYTTIGIHLIGHWLLGKCWLSAQQIRAPPCQICQASNPQLRHRCVVREVCDMKIYLALCCKRRPGGVTPSKPHLLQSQQSARRDHRPSISASSFFSWLALARDPPCLGLSSILSISSSVVPSCERGQGAYLQFQREGIYSEPCWTFTW